MNSNLSKSMIKEGLNKTDKRMILMREFQQLEVGLDKPITANDLKFLLDKNMGKQFDNEVFNQFYDRIKKTDNDRVTINGFIDVFIEADLILTEKIQLTRNELENLKRLRKQICLQMEEDKRLEQLNEYGISDESRITIKLLNAQFSQDIQPQLIQTYFVVQVGQWQEETPVQSGNRPTYDLSYYFQVQTGNEYIGFYLKDGRNHSLIGKVEMELQEINNIGDQNVHSKTFSVNNGQVEVCRLNVQIQWIHSKVKAYQTHINFLDKEIQELDDDLVEYERDHATICEPFKELNRTTHYNKQINMSGIKQPVDNAYDYHNKQQNQYSMSKLTLLFILSAMLGCIVRPLFMDLLIVSCYLVFYQHDKLYRTQGILLIGMLVISTILDSVFGYFCLDIKKSISYVWIANYVIRLLVIIDYLSILSRRPHDHSNIPTQTLENNNSQLYVPSNYNQKSFID